ncbi:MAG TPA: helix-turn-helix domain-containing protein [Acetobacteraceae bacterium]|nr:helix-turn-helix domain-containing protein [Acetobacteraceae bacterium]
MAIKRKAKIPPRVGGRETEANVLASAHQIAKALHSVGAMDDLTMQDMDRLCLPPRPSYGMEEVRRIRKATRMSQPLFAELLGVGKSSVVQWESGARRPSGPALRLLEALDPQRPDNPIARVRRRMRGPRGLHRKPALHRSTPESPADNIHPARRRPEY